MYTVTVKSIVIHKFSYIQNYSADEGTILLYNNIGSYVDESGSLNEGINGERFAYELQYLGQNCSHINVRINSGGGSVLEGYSIVSAILNSKIPVYTYIDGMAASTAGWIAVAGKRCHMMDYGTFMMHNPSGGEDKVLDVIKNTIVTILSNRSNKTPEEVSKLMNRETWMSPKECLEAGIIDEIISSGKKVKINKTDSLLAITNKYNKILNQKGMSQKVNTLLKLKNDAEEVDQLEAINALNKQLAEKDEQLKKLTDRLTEIENERKEAEKKEAEKLKADSTELVNKAAKEGLLDASEVETTIANASKDRASFEFVKNFISKLKPGKTSHKPFNSANVKEDATEDRSKWNYRDWEKNDNAGLVKMYSENRAQFDELVKTLKK